jgi:hypothetical protein
MLPRFVAITARAWIAHKWKSWRRGLNGERGATIGKLTNEFPENSIGFHIAGVFAHR